MSDELPGQTASAVSQVAADDPLLVDVRALSRSFGETRALISADLSIGRGEIHALAGENGSGKTTLIKVLSGVLRPDAGSVRWAGEPVTFSSPSAAQSRGIVTVFQETLVAAELSVRHNVFLGVDGLFRRRTSTSEEYERAGATLAELGLEGIDLDRPLWALSLAQRQIVTIARAMVQPWELLILDEGTSALDANQRDRLFDALRRARALGKSVLFTSHRMDEVEQLADSVSVLRVGSTVGRSLMSETSPRAILALMAEPEEVAASQAERVAEPLRERMVASGQPVLRLADLVLRPGASPISLTVARGEILGLAGLEGQGQIEFAETLCGLRGRVNGEVGISDDTDRWHAVRRSRDARRAGIAYVPRDRKQEGLFFPLSILDNFSLALLGDLNRFGVVRRLAVRREFDEIAARMSLTPRNPRDLVGVLSGGNQQKVLLGRWLATNPRLLVLNDPFRGVDANTKHDLYALFRNLADQGMAIVLVSTEVLELLTLCDRIAVFHDQTVNTVMAARETSDARVIAAMFGESA